MISATKELRLTLTVKNQYGNWHHFQTKYNEADTYRVAQRRAESTGKRHRLVDGDGRLIDLLDP